MLEFLVDGADEVLDVFVAFLFGLLQSCGDLCERLAVQVFERGVLELVLDGIQSQLVCQRGIQVAGLAGDIGDKLLVGVVVDGTHEGEPVDRHDEDDAHVLGKGQQQLVEILVLDSRLLLVERSDMQQAVHHPCDVLVEQHLDALGVKIVAAAQVVDERGDDHRAVGRDGVAQRQRRGQVPYNGIQAVAVPLEDSRLGDALEDEPVQRVDVTAGELVAQPVVEAFDKLQQEGLLLGVEIFLYHRHR